MLTLAQLAAHLDGVWHGNANHAIFSLASLSRATIQDVTYYDQPLPPEILTTSLAGAVLLREKHQHLYSGNRIIVADPLKAMARIAELLSGDKKQSEGVDPTAFIHPSAQVGQGVSIGAFSVIDAGVILADTVRIGANSTIEADVKIGTASQIGSNVVVHMGCQLGAHTVLHSGCVVGAAPFNYLKQRGKWQQGPVAGGVIIADGVHLGANTVIDRGTLGDTYIAEGVCIDNLVQIAHDVCVGKNTIIAGCAAVGAYTQIGADCVIGGASCVAAYVTLTDDVVITGMSTVSKSITKSGIYSSGTLVHEHQRWRKNAARFRRLDDYMVKLAVLEKKIGEIE